MHERRSTGESGIVYMKTILMCMCVGACEYVCVRACVCVCANARAFCYVFLIYNFFTERYFGLLCSICKCRWIFNICNMHTDLSPLFERATHPIHHPTITCYGGEEVLPSVIPIHTWNTQNHRRKHPNLGTYYSRCTKLKTRLPGMSTHICHFELKTTIKNG